MFLHTKHAALGSIKSSSDTDCCCYWCGCFWWFESWWVMGERAGICDRYQFMIMFDQWVQDQKHFNSFMHSRIVIQSPYLMGHVKWQHGRLKCVWERCRGIRILKFSLWLCDRTYNQFVHIMYVRSSTANRVNDTRLDLFARKQRPYNSIPRSLRSCSCRAY